MATADEDLKFGALADAVQNRRHQLKLKQGDLEGRGGPSTGTVRNVEQQARTTKYAARTMRALEMALELETGVLDRVLDGSLAVNAPELSAETAEEGVQRRLAQAYAEDPGPATVKEARDRLRDRPVKPSYGSTPEQRIRRAGGPLAIALDVLNDHPTPDESVVVAFDAVLDVVDQLGIKRQWDEAAQRIWIVDRG